jgi:hypothetical protein
VQVRSEAILPGASQDVRSCNSHTELETASNHGANSSPRCRSNIGLYMDTTIIRRIDTERELGFGNLNLGRQHHVVRGAGIDVNNVDARVSGVYAANGNYRFLGDPNEICNYDQTDRTVQSHRMPAPRAFHRSSLEENADNLT